MKNINCRFIVLERTDRSSTKDGAVVHEFLVADASGAATFILWNEQGEAVDEADVLLLTQGYTTMYRGSLRLAHRIGHIRRVGRFAMLFRETPNVSRKTWVVDPRNPHAFVPCPS
jgi:hypothetical protein